MDGNLNQLNKRFDKVDSEIAELKTDVAVLKTDVATLKTDVAVLKIGLGQVEKKLDGLINSLADWKSELFDDIDGLASEIRDSRDFRVINSSQTSSNTRRIEIIEKKVFGSVASV